MVVWLGAATGATAEELVATRPGVMCASADTLSRLTLPNGDSRTHAAAPRPDDLAAAAAGGCIDIPAGARVTVQEAFRNTSRVVYAGPGAPAGGVVTIPNVDFQPVGAATAIPVGPMPPGLAVVARVPSGPGLTVLLLMDKRITPSVREAMQGSGGDPNLSFDSSSPLYAEFTRHPPLNAMFVLQNADGVVVERRQTDRPLASIKAAGLAGLPHPAVFLTVNNHIGMGGWNGLNTDMVVPAETGLQTVRAITSGGRTEAVALVEHLHADWQVTPSRTEILSVFCNGSFDNRPRQEYETFRFVGGHWTVASRLHDGCDEIEVLPPRREFP